MSGSFGPVGAKKLEFEDEVRIRRIGDQLKLAKFLKSREELAVRTISIPTEGFREESAIRSCVGNED